MMNKPDLGEQFFIMVQELGPTMWVFMQWPMLEKFAMSLPESEACTLGPPLKQLFKILKVLALDLLVYTKVI
jgi:hypothetical protein